MARTYYHSRTEANAVAYDRQVKREEFWAPVLEALANVGAFIAFLLYCALWAGAVVLTGYLLYFMFGGTLNIFGVFVPGISVR